MARSKELLTIRNLLVRRRDALRSALAGDLSLLREQADGDEVDWAVDAMQDEINSQLAEVESRELMRIEEALERIREGTFGACADCGKGIPVDRLRAIPYATTCIACQREAERRPIERMAEIQWPDRDSSQSDDDIRVEDLEMESY